VVSNILTYILKMVCGFDKMAKWCYYHKGRVLRPVTSKVILPYSNNTKKMKSHLRNIRTSNTFIYTQIFLYFPLHMTTERTQLLPLALMQTTTVTVASFSL
jgi:hypothetical protein